MSIEERKAQLEFVAVDNTKDGTDSVKAGLQDIASTAVDASGKAAAALDNVAKAGVETGQQLDRSTASISTSIKRVISDTQRQIATLKAEASGGGTVDIFENLISQRGANADALKPLIGNLRTLRSELDSLRQAEQRSAVDVNYERERAAAEIARRRADATAALTQVIEQQEAAERRLAGQNAFVQSLKAQSDAIGKTKADLLELQAAQLGVSGQAAPYIAKLREQEQALTQNSKVLNAYGKTSKETAAALRQVPAQITDIVVSLQGGQAPLTVLLQQGGQLKDVFGGVVPALKGVASGVVGLVNPYTLAAAAAAALAIAYYQGSQEADAYNRAIVLTGNAAGVTAAQLKTTAVAISQTVGTQGAAAEVLAQLAQTGQVAGANMQRFGEVTLKVQRDLGISAKDTVKDFAALGESPVEASLKLTKQYGYLTAATLEQIKALQDQGKAQEAATLAQNTYATAMDTKADRLRAQLGTIERAWQGITSAAKSGWDAILNVGRAETSADRLADLQRQLEQRMSTPLAVDNEAMRKSREKAIAYLKEQIGLLQSDERAQRRGAEAEAERQRIQEAGTKAFDAVTKAQEKGLSKQEQLNKALKEYRDRLEDLKKANPESTALSPAAVARGEKAIRDQFAEKGGGDRGAEGRQAELADLDAKIKAEKDYTQQLRERGIQAEKNNAGTKLSDSIQQQLNGTLSATTRAFLEQKLERAKLLETATKDREEEEKRQKAIAKSEETLRKQTQAVYDEASAVEQQRQKLDETTAAYGKSALAVAKLTAERIKLRLAEAEGSDSFDPAYVENLRRLLAEQQKLVASVGVAEYERVARATKEQTLQAQEQNDLLELEISLIGRSEVERKKIVAAREQELKLAKELRDIEKLGLDDDQTERLKSEKREEYRVKAANAANKVVLDDWNKTADMISTSLTDALLRGFESGKSFAQNFRDTLKNLFNTLVLRPVISAVVNPIAGAVSGVVNSTLYGGASALAGGANVFTGLQGTTGLLGNLGTLLGTNTVATNAALAGTIGIDSASALAAAKGASAAGGGALGGLLSNPLTIGLGAVLALSALSKATKGETRTGGQFGVAFDGSVTNQRRDQTYTIEGQQFDRDFTNGLQNALKNGIAYRLEGDPVAQEQAIRDAVAGTASGINGLLKSLGSEAVLTGFSAGLETSSKGRGGVFAGGLLSTGQGFGESGRGDNYAGTLYEAFSTNSPDFKTALENFTLDLKQSTIQALQVVTDIPKSVQKILTGVDAEALTEDAANKLLETINAQIVGVEQLRSAFDAMNMQKFANLAFDSAAAVAELSGGFDKLGNNLGTFYENFYSEGERTANTSRVLAKSLSELGLALPANREQYRALVEAQDLNTEAGQRAYATLLQLSGAFAGITESAEAAANAAAKAAEAERKRIAALVQSAQKIVDSQRQTLEGLRTQAQNDLFTATGGLVGGIRVQASEAEGALRFKTALDGASEALSELTKLGLGDRFSEFADQVAEVVQGTKDLLGAQLSGARLLAGDTAGALAARQQARALDPEKFGSAGAYNQAFARQQAEVAVDLIRSASTSALVTQNVGVVIAELQGVLTRDDLWQPVFAQIREGLSGGSSGLRTALSDAAEFLARQAVASQYDFSGPGIASVFAARQGVTNAATAGFAGGRYQIGADVLAYGQAIDSLNRAQQFGSITAEEYDRGLAAINASFVDAAPLLGDTAAQVDRLKGAYLGLANSGFASIGFYFTSLTEQAKALADAAAAAREPIAQTTGAIGRLNSISTAFGESARAVIEGLAGAGEQGRYTLMQEGLTGSQTSRAQLIAQSAAIAAGVITTADAAAAAKTLMQSEAFAGLTAAGIRDASLLLEGAGAFDPKGFENAFLRINSALAAGTVNEAQYRVLFDTLLGIFQGVETSGESLASSMKRLRDAMKGFADELLIDQSRTTLSPGATLAEMRRQYAESFSAASAGDSDAINRFQELATGLLNKNLYVTQAEYNAAFGRVYGDARALEQYGAGMLSGSSNPVVAELKDSKEKLDKRVAELEDKVMTMLAVIAKNTSDTNKGIRQQTLVIEEQ